jgi:hypothetical protein
MHDYPTREAITKERSLKPYTLQPAPFTESQKSDPQPGNSLVPSSVNLDRAAANAQAAIQEGKRLEAIARKNMRIREAPPS